MSKRDVISVPVIAEYSRYIPNGDQNKQVFGAFEYNAYGHDYSSLMSFAFTRATKAAKRHNATIINVQLKADYDVTTNTLTTWKGHKVLKFPKDEFISN